VGGGLKISAGILGGLIGAGLARATTPTITITSNKETLSKQSIGAGASVTLKPSTNYKFAIMLFHGDGDPQVRLDIAKGATTVSVYGNEQAIEILANESISIVAVNTDTANPRNTPTIEIISLSW
jgi:hypothetical protein